jgi:hypothetical protein
VSNKTLAANCVLGGDNGLTISGAALTSATTYGSISLTCSGTTDGTLTISDIGGEDHKAKMTFGELLFTGANIAATGSNRDIGISATGTGVIYLKSPVASIAVSNDAEFNGAMYIEPTKASGTYNVTADDSMIISMTTGGPVNINLPSANDNINRYLIIKNLTANSTNKTTLVLFSGDGIDGNTSNYVMSSSYQSVTLVGLLNFGWLIV